MNNKNLVMLSEMELENISGGVTGKQVLGGFIEYGTATVSTVVLSVVGQLLGFGVTNKFVDGSRFLSGFDDLTSYIPGLGILTGAEMFIDGITHNNPRDILTGATTFTTIVGGGVGGWFAGRAIGKKLRKKLGL